MNVFCFFPLYYSRKLHARNAYKSTLYKTMDKNNNIKRLRNILKRDFDPSSPDAAWYIDITYI